MYKKNFFINSLYILKMSDQGNQTQENQTQENQTQENQTQENQTQENQHNQNQTQSNQNQTQSNQNQTQSNQNQTQSNQNQNNQNNQNQNNQNNQQTTVRGDGYQINTTQTNNVDVNVITNTTFNTTDPNAIPQITQDLSGNVDYRYDDNLITQSDNLANEIKNYAQLIKCDSFHGKGTIDDYNVLFDAASKIVNDSKQMELNIEIDGFKNFGQAADELSALFTSFTKKLKNINIINDINFLTAVLDALKKIYNLSQVFGKFKETIAITSEIKIPNTIHDTKVILQDVMSEVNCAMNYINNFVDPVDNLPQAQLSDKDKNIITKAAQTIDNWNELCNHGVSIALADSTDVQYIKQANVELKEKTFRLQDATTRLRNKFNNLHL